MRRDAEMGVTALEKVFVIGVLFTLFIFPLLSSHSFFFFPLCDLRDKL